MKTHTQPSLSSFSTEVLEQLTLIVAETLAFDALPAKAKTFTAAELWNIQRQKKAIRGRRGMM